MHKPPPKVHWHAYWMLSIGSVFLLLTAFDFITDMHRPHGDEHVYGGALGGTLGNSFAICGIIGLLFTGIGIYAIRTHKE